MVFCQVYCRSCKHEFYRVEVRCEKYPKNYVCPACSNDKTTKKNIQLKKKQKTAEDNPCCREESNLRADKTCKGCHRK